MTLIKFALSFITVALAQESKAPVNLFKCDVVKKEIQNLLPPSKELSDEKGVLSADKLRPAIQMLEKFPAPSQAEVDSSITNMNQNFPKFVPDYLEMLGAGCRPLRLDLSRWIMNTAVVKSTPAADKLAATAALKAMLLKPQYPTLLNASMSLAIVRSGLEKKLWNLSPREFTEFEKMRKDFTSQRLEKQSGWNQVEEVDLRNVNKVPPEEHAKLLAAHPKIKQLMMEEAEFSKKALERLTNLVKSL